MFLPSMRTGCFFPDKFFSTFGSSVLVLLVTGKDNDCIGPFQRFLNNRDNGNTGIFRNVRVMDS